MSDDVRHCRIVFFGDSYMSCPGLEPAEAWPAQVMARLEAEFAGRVAFNCAVRTGIGDTTRAALERMFDDVQSAEPHIVCMQFGANDATHFLSMRGAPLVSQAAYRANLEEMLDRARRFGTLRVVINTNHPVAKDRFEINGLRPDDNVAAYDAITREIARRHLLLLADVRAAAARIDARTLCQPAPDEVHPSTRAATLYADTVTPPLVRAVEGLLAVDQLPTDAD